MSVPAVCRILIACLGISGACLSLGGLFAAESRETSRRPNFVVILGEGHGWASTSVRMDDAVPASQSRTVRTPNLEKLARAGMRFANFYAPSPRCTPSRAGLLTGISPARLHMTFVGEGRDDTGGVDAGRRLLPPRCVLELPESATTIAELLKGAGYATAHFGKWHLGRVSPSRHGFDESDGPTHNGGPDNVDNPHPEQLYGMTQRGVAFMARQAQAGKPFYLQLSHYGSRRGGDASPEAVAAVKAWAGDLRQRDMEQAAADWDLDLALGQFLAKIDSLGLADNTYVIFTTDHGSPGRNPPLAGGKGAMSDGGLRVPLIVRGPGVAPGSCSHVRSVGVDLFPTLAELARIDQPLPKETEGGSLAAPLLAGGHGTVRRPREEYVVHFPHYDKDGRGPASAIYLGDFKLLRVYESGESSLWNTADDPGERRNLAATMPEKAAQLDRRLSTYLAAVGAQLPTENSRYDPSRHAAESAKPARDKPARGKARSKQPSQDSSRSDVPAHPFDLILGRPTRDSVTLSVLAYRDLEGHVAYGPEQGQLTQRTASRRFAAGEPAQVLIESLRPDTRYAYQFRAAGQAPAGGFFHTQRPAGSEFTFTVTADSHLDDRVDASLYRRTLANARSDEPDFHIDLGDTFMSEKYDSRAAAQRQYLAQRYYFDSLCRAAPLFLALGNHDGESPRGRGQEADSLAVWSNRMRKRYFPNPEPDGFYSGNSNAHPEAGLLQDYYAWHWGDALFVVLDPYWFAERQRGRGDLWRRTLGEPQYRWLAKTLESSRARFKFVFIHQLVGGMDEQGRGGVEAAPFYEWGGKNQDGSDGFRQNRPAWPAPIHELLVRYGVTVVFHGHDHFYAVQQLDGVVYQEVPQPGTPGPEKPRQAEEYGYRSGVIHGGAGHLRVRVTTAEARVEYVQTDRSIRHSYSIAEAAKARGAVGGDDVHTPPTIGADDLGE